MIEPNAPHIDPPPSVEDIVSTDQERIGRVDFTSRLVPEPDPDPETVLERRDAATPTIRPAAAEPAAGATSESAADQELPYLGLSVEQVAESVSTRIRQAGGASRRHLESIEAEAARRCELLTAQAELEAELIRLHARREAHAIITAARMRAGGGTSASADGQRLEEIGETLSRFAETIETDETVVADAPRSPDLPSQP